LITEIAFPELTLRRTWLRNERDIIELASPQGLEQVLRNVPRPSGARQLPKPRKCSQLVPPYEPGKPFNAQEAKIFPGE
jgi:hypothetical protein